MSNAVSYLGLLNPKDVCETVRGARKIQCGLVPFAFGDAEIAKAKVWGCTRVSASTRCLSSPRLTETFQEIDPALIHRDHRRAHRTRQIETFLRRTTFGQSKHRGLARAGAAIRKGVARGPRRARCVCNCVKQGSRGCAWTKRVSDGSRTSARLVPPRTTIFALG